MRAASAATFAPAQLAREVKKLVILVALAFALVGGTAVVMTVHSQPAMADGSCSGC